MKKLLLGGALLLGTMMATQQSQAQVRVGVNINIGDQPSWRDPHYDYVDYYYLPDIETYYYVPTRQFIYLSNGRWVFSASLPARYRSYNLYSAHKIVVNRPNAYRYFEEDRRRYGRPSDFRRHDRGRHNGWKKHRGHH